MIAATQTPGAYTADDGSEPCTLREGHASPRVWTRPRCLTTQTDMLSFYQWQLVVLGSACVLLLSLEKYALRKTTAELEAESNATPAIVSRLSRRYLCVYAIVMGERVQRRCRTVIDRHSTPTGADWLQGPYIYSLYREQYELPERLVALLFVLGFLSAGLAAPLVGIWADQ